MKNLIAAMLAALVMSASAYAADLPSESELEHRKVHELWINRSGATSPADGTHCCGKNDCFVISKDDMSPTPAGWLIDPTSNNLGAGETITYGETQQSEDDDFWRCKRYDGSRRCFFAPPSGF